MLHREEGEWSSASSGCNDGEIDFVSHVCVCVRVSAYVYVMAPFPLFKLVAQRIFYFALQKFRFENGTKNRIVWSEIGAFEVVPWNDYCFFLSLWRIDFISLKIWWREPLCDGRIFICCAVFFCFFFSRECVSVSPILYSASVIQECVKYVIGKCVRVSVRIVYM